MAQYKAYEHVVLGNPDENAYNMYCNVLEIFGVKLRLWKTKMNWVVSQRAFHANTYEMKSLRLSRKLNVEKELHKNDVI